MKNQIVVEIVYALPDQQCLLTLKVEEGSTIAMAIEQSGILSLFPGISLDAVGVFGKRRALSDVLQSGDRIEIYRPLIIDPMEARRAKVKRAARKK